MIAKFFLSASTYFSVLQKVTPMYDSALLDWYCLKQFAEMLLRVAILSLYICLLTRVLYATYTYKKQCYCNIKRARTHTFCHLFLYLREIRWRSADE